MASRPPAEQPWVSPVEPLPLRSPRRSWAPLPVPLTSLVGRQREIAAVRALLGRDEVRLVTLTGPGGVGKTRLALEAARGLGSSFPNGIAFVPLASVRHADLVAATVARAFNLETGDRPPLAALKDHLRDRRLLLVLDNFEHLLPAAPQLTDLLESCPDLKLLVTTRVRLRLAGEYDFPVPPLAVPDPPRDARHPPSVDHLSTYAAVRLFVDRARAAYPAFALTPANATAVAELCRRLDGLPLAIELAAARIRVLSPPALLARLTNQLRVMTDGPQNLPPRLRSMRAAIAWSHDLLDAAGQALFRRLAVFVGGFTLEAAEHVAEGLRQEGPGTSPDHAIARPASVLDGLTALVDESLVQRGEGPDGEARYTMLETVREFGVELLAASGEEAAVRDAHAAWCLALAERAEPELSTPNQQPWFDRLVTETPNLRAALGWVRDRADTERALRLAGALGLFWTWQPFLREGRSWLEAVLAMPGVDAHPRALAKVLSATGDVAQWQNDTARAIELFD